MIPERENRSSRGHWSYELVPTCTRVFAIHAYSDRVELWQAYYLFVVVLIVYPAALDPVVYIAY